MRGKKWYPIVSYVPFLARNLSYDKTLKEICRGAGNFQFPMWPMSIHTPPLSLPLAPFTSPGFDLHELGLFFHCLTTHIYLSLSVSFRSLMSIYIFASGTSFLFYYKKIC